MTTKKNTSLMQNPASRVTLGSKKTTATRKTTSSRGRTTNRKNPTTMVKKRRYRRNTAAAGAAALFATAFGALLGAIGINFFDFGVNRLAPTTSAGIRTGVKAAIGTGLLLFGNKLPFGRSYAPVIGGAFMLAASLDFVASYLMPTVTNLFAPSAPALQITSSAPGVTTTGEMGMIHQLANGGTLEVLPPLQQFGNGWNQPTVAIV